MSTLTLMEPWQGHLRTAADFRIEYSVQARGSQYIVISTDVSRCRPNFRTSPLACHHLPASLPLEVFGSFQKSEVLM